MAEVKKPLPQPDEETRPFWDFCRAHELRVQRCKACGLAWLPAGPVCPSCWSESIEWQRTRGEGTVFTYCVFHRSYHPAFEEEIPYVVAVVELAEGPRLMSNIVGCRPAEVHIGMPVQVVFTDAGEGFVLPKFRRR